MRQGEELIGAVVLERTELEEVSPREMMLLRLIVDMVTPRMKDLQERDKWVGGRITSSLRKSLAWVVGTKHTLAKVIAISLLIFFVLIISVKITYRVESTFILKADEKRIVAAPFDGFIEEAAVNPGDKVQKDITIVAKLETAENQTKLITKEAEAKTYHKESAVARREKRIADAQIATAKAEQAEAECSMLRDLINRAVLRAPSDGVVLTGEWHNRLGGPIKQGETLYEIAPLSGLQAELFISDSDIADIKFGQKGELAVAGHPASRFEFTVENISPVAELVKQKNIFRVVVHLKGDTDWMKPGMEGVAKIDIDQRSPAAIWTRTAVNWVRMKLWL